MKKILATMTVGAAILASASLAKANAYLELVSGSTSTSTSYANASSALDGVALSATVGGWTALATFGNASAAPSAIDVSVGNVFSSTETTPLWVLLSVDATGGGPPVTGGWSLQTLNGSSAPTLNVYAYQSSAIYGVEDTSAPLALTGLSLFGSDLNDSAAASTVGGTVTGLEYYTEVIEVIPGAGLVGLSIDTTLSLPDGGLTMAMLGSVLVGMVGIRSKFAKRA